MLNQTFTEENLKINLKKQCTQCNKYKVCLLTKAITQILTQHFNPQTTPIQPNQLAEICKEHQSQSIITQLTTNLTEENKNEM